MGTRGLVLLLACAAGLCFAAIAIGASSPKHITPSGVDGVKLGKTYRQLHNRHLIGSIRHGCELGGPNTRTARLRAPLKGSVNFTLTKPRKVTDITIRGGATARGIGIGATITQIKAKFPKAKVDHSTDQTFELTLVKIPKNGGGRMMFAVSTKTHKTTLIGVPIIAFCE
ncbi:MAG TPA: hypothetical protein VJU79_07760 [Candidatus Dormibacteraeota bacterium]|nr:hypothetical protein [Candidatus Dormibacteraeota bacterium]